MSWPGHKGAYGSASPESEAEIIREWRELHNGTQGAVGAEFDAFRQGFLYGVDAERSRGRESAVLPGEVASEVVPK